MKLTGFYTQKGASLAAQAQAAESGLVITRAAAGSGVTNADQTAMAREDQALELHGLASEGEHCTVTAVLTSGQTQRDFLLREVGLFARLNGGPETLYKLFRLDETICVETGVDLTVTFHLTESILHADQVSVVVNQQGLVTQQVCRQLAQEAASQVAQSVDSHLSDTKAHSTLFAQKASLAHTHAATKITAGTFPGQVAANANTAYTTAQIRNITLSPDEPGDGSNGQLWVQYDE